MDQPLVQIVCSSYGLNIILINQFYDYKQLNKFSDTLIESYLLSDRSEGTDQLASFLMA
jgi:hypothetical protein